MSKEGKFAAYCVEMYRYRKKLTGHEIVELFEKHKVWDYLYECYGALHTEGEEAIIADIDEYIASHS